MPQRILVKKHDGPNATDVKALSPSFIKIIKVLFQVTPKNPQIPTDNYAKDGKAVED